MNPLLRVVCLSLPLLWLGCSEGGANCVAGMSVSCACTDGRMGSQTCGAGGVYQACQCTGVVPGDMAGAEDMAGSGGPKRLFVTSLRYRANALSTVCQNVADAESLGGTWKAWVSGVGPAPSSAIGRIQSQGPWKLLNGEVVFKKRAQLATQPDTAIRITEQKVLLGLNEYAWTGTSLGGTSSGNTCNGWTSVSATEKGTYGNPDSIQAWTDNGLQPCDQSLHVYCLED